MGERGAHVEGGVEGSLVGKVALPLLTGQKLEKVAKARLTLYIGSLYVANNLI